MTTETRAGAPLPSAIVAPQRPLHVPRDADRTEAQRVGAAAHLVAPLEDVVAPALGHAPQLGRAGDAREPRELARVHPRVEAAGRRGAAPAAEVVEGAVAVVEGV